jgi:hypothetical protein
MRLQRPPHGHRTATGPAGADPRQHRGDLAWEYGWRRSSLILVARFLMAYRAAGPAETLERKMTVLVSRSIRTVAGRVVGRKGQKAAVWTWRESRNDVKAAPLLRAKFAVAAQKSPDRRLFPNRLPIISHQHQPHHAAPLNDRYSQELAG